MAVIDKGGEITTWYTFENCYLTIILEDNKKEMTASKVGLLDNFLCIKDIHFPTEKNEKIYIPLKKIKAFKFTG